MVESDVLSAAGSTPSTRAFRSVSLAYVVLPAALVLALALRVWLNVRGAWLIDGDEALFGIGALRILHGERPIFLYGVPYMGMVQAYVAAPLVALFGPTRPALRAVTIAGSLSYVAVTWLLARQLYDATVAAVAALVAAVPSVYFDAVALKVWGSYIGVMALGGLVLYGVWRCRCAGGRLGHAAWFGIGLAAGLALWANFLVAYYLATAALLLPWRHARRWLPGAVLVGLPALLIGSAPVWLYNLAHHWATLHFLFGGAGASGQPGVAAVAGELGRVLVPRVLGLTSPWSPIPHAAGVLLGGVLALALLLAMLDTTRVVVGAAPRGRPASVAKQPALLGTACPVDPGQARARRAPAAPTPTSTGRSWPLLLFLAVTIAVYLVSGFGRPSLSPFDASGRYLLPLWTAVPILVAALCVHIGRAQRWAGALLVAVVLGVNLYGHVTSAPRLVFQSPYWANLPEQSAPLRQWLLARDVHAVWMNHWAGNQLMYETGLTVLSADYYDVEVGHGINRLPDIFTQVAAADRTAYVVVMPPGTPADAVTPLEQALRKLGVSYERADFLPYEVFLPSRHVDPAQVADGLRYPY